MTRLLAEKVLVHAADPSTLAFCPTADLIALASSDQRVHVYRFDGQEVFAVSPRAADGTITCVKWKPNGETFVVAFSGNTVSLYNSLTGKENHRIDCSRLSPGPAQNIGWGAYCVEEADLQAQLRRLKDLLRNAHADEPDDPAESLDNIPNLPKELSTLDVEGLLPKLSPLTSVTPENELFATRTGLDSVFKSAKYGNSEPADILVLALEDGSLHLTMYDFFDIGTFKPDNVMGFPVPHQVLRHCYNPYFSTQSLLVSYNQDGQVVCGLVFVDLRFLGSAGRLLSIVASKSTQLLHLLRYIQQVQLSVYDELKSVSELPNKFISLLEETLAESNEWSWLQAAYHLVATGDCPKEVKEWLVDQVGERGQKRWDKAVTTAYENARRLTHEHLIPALERFLVLISRIKGLADFQESNHHLGISTQDVDIIIDRVGSLQLLSHRILLVVNDELQLFIEFSAWMRQEIQIQSSDAGMLENLDTANEIDHRRVLCYIEGPMIRSSAYQFIDAPNEVSRDENGESQTQPSLLFDKYAEEIAGQGKPDKKRRQQYLPRFHELIHELGLHCRKVFRDVAETQKQRVTFKRPLVLCRGRAKTMDIRMIRCVGQIGVRYSQYVAVEDSIESGSLHGETGLIGAIRLIRYRIAMKNGVSDVESSEQAILNLKGWEVLDIQFVDDTKMLVAAKNDNSSRLLMIPYGHENQLPNGAKYEPIDPKSADVASSDGQDLKVDPVTWLKFPKGSKWTPQRIVVNRRAERQAVCVLAADNCHYRVYDIEAAQDEDEAM